MKLSRGHKTLAILVAGIGGWLLVGSENPSMAARAKCQQHLPQVAGRPFSQDEISAMSVTGDAHNGKVQGALLRSDQLHYVVCEFENGETKRAEIDGSAWPDVDRAGIVQARLGYPSGGAAGEGAREASPPLPRPGTAVRMAAGS